MEKTYGIGLDIGTSSIGWSIVDENARLMRVKGKTGIGVRLFREGKTAADRRNFRTTRRRLSRRRWRLRLLREIFDEPVSQADPNFFARLKNSSLAHGDSRFESPYRLFNDRTDKDFYKQYPTMYHLRQALMTEHRQFDIREIYLAVHHLVKYRGNFLNSASPKSFKPGQLDLSGHFATLNKLFEEVAGDWLPVLPTSDLDGLKVILTDANRTASDRQKAMTSWLIGKQKVSENQKAFYTELGKAIMWQKAKLFTVAQADVGEEDQALWTMSLDTLDDKLPDLETLADDTQLAIIEELSLLCGNVKLSDIIPGGMGLSEMMVQRYEDHKEHLTWLNAYINEQTDHSRGKAIRQTYDHYISGDEKGKAVIQKDFHNALKKYTKTDQGHSEWADKIAAAIAQDRFMPKQRDKSNGVIPHQLHQQELDAIIENQKAYYPWLAAENPVVEHRQRQPYKLDELVSFRVPYYVGPMGETYDEETRQGSRFAWMIRHDGPQEPITPWNFDQQVDKTASANEFIQRVKTTDTYLIGEDVLPKQSLLYQRFEVLNELNNISVGWDHQRLTTAQKQRVYKEVFKTKKIVHAQDVLENLRAHSELASDGGLFGLADPKKFNSGLTTYHEYRQIMPDAIDDPDKRDDIEHIIEWSTIFEDTSIYLQQLASVSWLNDDQRRRLSAKRYRGWGQLSRKLLMAVTDDQGRSIMDQLWQTGHNFMQIVKWPSYAEQINRLNSDNVNKVGMQETINQLYTSPQNKKAIRQVLLVVKDIQKAMNGQAPKWLFIEVARGADKKARRSKRRLNQIEEVYKKTARGLITPKLKAELASVKDSDNLQDQMYLYFMQNGKDIYSGETLNIDQLSDYQIDHILPRAIIKDDSLDNRVLVTRDSNQRKGKNFASDVFPQRRYEWRELQSAGLISRRKLKHLLMRPNDLDKYAHGFINRQLVETRQVVKLVTDILSNEFSSQGTQLVLVKAGLTRQFRQEETDLRDRDDHNVVDELYFPKIRELNDYHHAFDAYLAARIGMYLLKQYPKLHRFFVYGQFQAGKSDLRRFNFIRDLKQKSQPIVTRETGEITWNHDEEVAYLTRIFGYKHMLVTHELTENHGPMFNQTIYGKEFDSSHPGASKRLIPIKHDRPTALYGGYSGQVAAYTVIVKFWKKKQPVFRAYPLPRVALDQIQAAKKVSSAAEIAALKEVLKPYFTKMNKKTGEQIVEPFEIAVPHVLFGQPVIDELSGVKTRFALGTNTYYRSEQQLFWTLEQQRTFRRKDVTSNELNGLYEHTCQMVEKYYPLYDINGFRKGLRKHQSDFEALPVDDVVSGNTTAPGKKTMLLRIMTGLHANASFGDLKSLGIKTPFGKMQRDQGIFLSAVAQIIHESPTGLFSTKSTLN